MGYNIRCGRFAFAGLRSGPKARRRHYEDESCGNGGFGGGSSQHRRPDTELIGQWTDPSFDPQAYTTYYARVLEIPTPRWSTYWAAKLHLPPNPNVAAAVQQRAWTWPIYYTPPEAAK